MPHTKAGHAHRLRAACALAELAPGDARWPAQAADVVLVLTAETAAEASASITRLRPIGKLLLPALREARKPARDPDRARIALRALADYLPEDGLTEEFVDIARSAAPAQLRDMAATLRPIEKQAEVLEKLREACIPAVTDEDEEPVHSVNARANAAVLLLLLGDRDPTLQALEAGPDQTFRFAVIDRLGIAVDRDDAHGTCLEGLSGDLADSVLQELLLTLRGCGPTTSRSGHDPMVKRVAAIYRDHADPGVHAAAGWLLCQWGREAEVVDADKPGQAAGGPTGGRRWFLGPEGHCFAVVRGPVSFGSSHFHSDDTKRFQGVVVRDESVQAVLGHSYAISLREVTRGQMRRFRTYRARQAGSPLPDAAQTPSDDNLPETSISPGEANEYCAWLDELLDPGTSAAGPGAGFGRSRRRGFRIPTGVEWEYAARGGSTTPRFFGRDAELLDRVSVFLGMSKGQPSPAGTLWPNAMGLFDIYGNAAEMATTLGLTPDLYQACGASAKSVKTLLSSHIFDEFTPDGAPDLLGLRISITLPSQNSPAAPALVARGFPR